MQLTNTINYNINTYLSINAPKTEVWVMAIPAYTLHLVYCKPLIMCINNAENQSLIEEVKILVIKLVMQSIVLRLPGKFPNNGDLITLSDCVFSFILGKRSLGLKSTVFASFWWKHLVCVMRFLWKILINNVSLQFRLQDLLEKNVEKKIFQISLKDY